MYEVIRTLDEKRYTPTRAMTLILARCCHCGAEQTLVEQNVIRANRQRRQHCPVCKDADAHRMTGTRFWRIWKGMKERATDPNSPDFALYGGAGRGVSEDWLDFQNFYRDMFSGYEDHLTIERVDNSKGYSKANCRWASNMEQQANKTNNRVLTYQGREVHLAELCRLAGVSRGAITPRLNQGMTAEEAVEDYRASRYPKGRKSRKCTT
jgi:hypothetical protein